MSEFKLPIQYRDKPVKVTNSVCFSKLSLKILNILQSNMWIKRLIQKRVIKTS